MISLGVMLALAVFILAGMMWNYDQHRRETWYMLLLALAAGALMRPIIGSVNDWLIIKVAPSSELWISILAGVGEELAKVLPVVLIAIFFQKQFDDPMDGVVYGSFVGLGFAISESCFYIPETMRMMSELNHRDLFGQEAIRAALHFLTGGIAGFGLGLRRWDHAGWRQLFVGWLLAAMLIHFLWDFACGLGTANDATEILFQRASAIALMLAALILFRVAVKVCHAWHQSSFAAGEALNARG